MAGRPGRNRAWNKIPVEEHVRRGTYRADRHGPWPQRVDVFDDDDDDEPAEAPLGGVWKPTAEEVAGLGDAGQKFLTQMNARFKSSIVQGVLLMEAAHAVDGLSTWRPQATTDKQAARLCVSLTKVLAQLLEQIRRS